MAAPAGAMPGLKPQGGLELVQQGLEAHGRLGHGLGAGHVDARRSERETVVRANWRLVGRG